MSTVKGDIYKCRIGFRYESISMTVPDMSYTIRDLLTKFTKLPDIQSKGIYEENPNIDEPIPLFNDLSDITEQKVLVRELTNKARYESKKAIDNLKEAGTNDEKL
jgi:hypothetical protein